jgi:1,2-phenylacetyl-CoA epoxidase catalytic subunit
VSEPSLVLGLDPEAAAPAANVVVAIADNKYFLARRLAEWGVAAPALESAVACTAIAQEEAGHARALYSLLQDFPRDVAPVALEREDDRERKYALSFVRRPERSFVRGIAALTLVDRALTIMLQACASSSFGELRKRAVRILGDEPFHQRYADGRARELALRPEFQAALAAFLPEALCWFGPDGEHGLELLVDRGIVSMRNDELRQAFLNSIGDLAARTGVVLPVERDRERWTYSELPWAEWNRLERRFRTRETSKAA